MECRKSFVFAISLCLPVLLLGGLSQAANLNKEDMAHVAYQKPGVGTGLGSRSGDLVLSAAPREKPEAAKEIYGPIAEYLSEVLGKKVVYGHAATWGIYQGQMQKGAYDLLFDGAHFNGWRAARLDHNVLVKVPGELTFVVATRKDSTNINSISQLAGRTVCAHAPPNFATLTLQKEFSNPSRQPVIINTQGWDNIFKGMLDGRCTAAVLPLKFANRNDADGKLSKIIYKAKVLPDNALSAGPRLSAEDQAKIATALLSERGQAVTAKLRDAYAGGKEFVRAKNSEYAHLAELLRNEWGYY